MDRVVLSDAEVLRALRSAGFSFFVLKVEDMLSRTRELDDKLLKDKLTEEYFETQSGFKDSKSSGTRVRVNSTYRIIRANRVEDALEMIINIGTSNSLYVEKAKEIKQKIEKGEIAVPQY